MELPDSAFNLHPVWNRGEFSRKQWKMIKTSKANSSDRGHTQSVTSSLQAILTDISPISVGGRLFFRLHYDAVIIAVQTGDGKVCEWVGNAFARETSLSAINTKVITCIVHPF